MSKKEFIRKIPLKFQEKLGLQRFKISLIKCKNKTQLKKSCMLLYFQVEKIFDNINEYDKIKSKALLKNTLLEFLLKDNNIEFKDIDKKVENITNKVTLETLVNNAILEKELVHKNKFKLMEKDGIDTNVKQKTCSTVRQYKSISNYLFKFFDKDLDIKELKKVDAKNFRKYLMSIEKEKLNKDTKEIEIINIDNNTINLYIRQMGSIFKTYIDENELDINNPFSNFKPLKVSKNKKMFTIKEIEESKEILNDEEYFVFDTLLKNGMRYEELCSIKKQNIRNNSFYFKDSKHLFDKVVPIHLDLLTKIDDRLKSLDNNDYVFFTNITKNRTTNTRPKFNEKLKENFDKTLHKTRTTFITYLNYYNDGFSDKDINSLTHKLQGVDDKNYVVTRNINNLKKIVNSINLKKLVEIEKATL